MKRDWRVLVFDLDDTLINTYGDLIVPLESEAARKMLQAQGAFLAASGQLSQSSQLPSEARLRQMLLHFRRCCPGGMPQALARRLPALSQAAWQAREEVLQGPSVSGLTRLPGSRRLLERLSLDYRLYLLTHGEHDFQMRKLRKSGLQDFFDSVRIVASGRDKGQALQDLSRGLKLVPGEAAVIGNRLDVEISLGCALGHPTVWMRHGEGCEMTAEGTGVRPDHVVESLDELEALLSS